MEPTLFTSIYITSLVLLAASKGLEGSVLPMIDLQSRQVEPAQTQTVALVDNQNSSQSQVNVRTTSGLLIGIKEQLNIGNNSVYKFLSVPYAEAPIKSLRFKRPVELNKLDQVVDASKFGKTCPQFRHLTNYISPLLNIDSEHQTSEDCLHLNLFVPSSVGSADYDRSGRLEASKQLPVIVWIPGEGFDFADARQFDGSQLATKTQSIVVTVQYRVGVLGFLHAPKFGIQGNMGIHDQLMALSWVRRNIAAFGGDSDRVTLMGRFTGSMSISTMITAPNQALTKYQGQSLFNRVAMLSGVAVPDWIIESSQVERVEELERSAAEKGLCNGSQIASFACFQDMPIDQLLPMSGYGWRLVVDNELIGTLSPIEAVKENQFATNLEGLLLGETGMEGTLCLYRHMLDARNNHYAQLIEDDKLTSNDLYDIIRDDSLTYFRYNLTKSNPIQLALETLADDSERTTANSEQDSLRLREKYLNACSSYMIKSHSSQLKKNVVSRNRLANNRMDSNKKPVDVFHYELRYKPTFSLAPEYIKTAAHGDDIPLIFGLLYNQPKRASNEADLLMTRKMMAMIGNFVHGNHPLLVQHSTIDSATTKNTENDTTSMDESEVNSSATFDGPSANSAAILKRSWSNEAQVYPVVLNESDLNELSLMRGHNSESESNSSNHNREPKTSVKGDRTNIRLIVIEAPLLNGAAIDMKAQNVVDQLIELRNQQSVEDLQQQQQQYENQMTRSQRLLEHHRQQMFEDTMWIQRRGSNPQQQQQQQQHQQQQQQQQQPQQTSMTLVTESSFMTMLVFSASIMILSLISICFGLFLLIVRNTNTKGIQNFTNSSSSCNICDDSQGGSLDAVLDAKRKKYRGFNNVFAKLKNHHHPVTQNQPQTCTSAMKQQVNNDVEMLNQRSENNAISDER